MPRPCGVPVPTPTRPSGNRHGRRGPRRGDPCGRPSRLQQASFPSYEVACHALAASLYRPQRGHRETGTGDEARVGATLAVAHPDSSTASFPSYEVACHALAASLYRPQRGHRETGTGDEARVGATLAVAHPDSSKLRFLRTRWRATPLRRPCTDPNEAIGKPARATARPAGAIAWATTSVGDDKRGRRQAWATTSVAPTDFPVSRTLDSWFDARVAHRLPTAALATGGLRSWIGGGQRARLRFRPVVQV